VCVVAFGVHPSEIWEIKWFDVLGWIDFEAKRNLARAGADYWSILAKVSNSWRSTHRGKQIHTAYANTFGKHRADLVASKLPPRPLRGRWGQATLTEAFILRCGPSELPTIFLEVFGTGAGADAKPRVPTARAEEDGLLLGELDKDDEHYSAKLNKWAHDACKGLQDPTFWRTLVVAHVSRSPSSHIQFWFRSQHARHGGDELPAIVQLVCGKADSVACEWDDLLLDDNKYPAWGDLVETLSEAEDAPPQNIE
jgi:hypothetical protein